MPTVGKPDTTRRPSTYDWLSAEDVMRHALAAFEMACWSADAYDADAELDGAPVDPDELLLGRRGLAERIAELLHWRLTEQGVQLGLPGFHREELEYLHRTAEYVDNYRQKLSQKPRKPDIHRRAFSGAGRAGLSWQLPARPPGPCIPRTAHLANASSVHNSVDGAYTWRVGSPIEVPKVLIRLSFPAGA